MGGFGISRGCPLFGYARVNQPLRGKQIAHIYAGLAIPFEPVSEPIAIALLALAGDLLNALVAISALSGLSAIFISHAARDGYIF